MAKTTGHKEGKATVKVVYYTHKTLKDGSHPFVGRITKDRKNRWISTGRSLPTKYWNDNYTDFRQAIRKSCPEPHRNDLIIELKRWEKKYSEAADTLAGTDEVHDVEDVASKAIEGRQQARRTKLPSYIDELTANMKRAGQLQSFIARSLVGTGPGIALHQSP